MYRDNEQAPVMVSVVIPTRGRPHLVLQAVESALAQTFEPIEVVVVVDGPDEATVRALNRVDDLRVRIVTLPAHMGATDARNAGVNEARGEWIALLDDDDEMLPRRLEVQIEAARYSPYALPIVTSRFVARTLKGEFIWPRRLMTRSELLSEYLFTRNSFFAGEGMISTSMLFVGKKLLEMVPFRSGLQRHQDWDWLLRANALQGVGIEFVSEPLVLRRMQKGRASISNRRDWRYMLAWIRENRDLVTSRAYAGFILTIVSLVAAQASDWKAFFPLLREAVQRGKPNAVELLLHIGIWLVSPKVRSQFRALLMTKDHRRSAGWMRGQPHK